MVTVPVGAAVQGDPLELHLYARDANGKDVSVTDQGSNNVVIAATGTGVTLTATPQGEGVDNDGHYWKYSLVPDTASYATQAIRYNTVTVEVNGAKVGTEYHAAWSPDVVLGGGDSLPYTTDEVQGIIKTCTDPILVVPQNGTANKLVYTSLPASTRIRCGTDGATGLRPYIIMQNATAPTEATIDATVTGEPTGIFDAGSEVNAAAPGSAKSFRASAVLKVDVKRTGGVKYSDDVYIVKGQPQTPFANGTQAGHKVASRDVVPSLVLTDQTTQTPAQGYRTSAGTAGLQYMTYIPNEDITIINRSVTLMVDGTYDVSSDATGTRATVTKLTARFHVMPGWDDAKVTGQVSIVPVDNFSTCAGGGNTSGSVYSDAAKSAFSCVSYNLRRDLSTLYQSRTADDLFGSATHPALSGQWSFYMDVQ
ncbi:hypothetical protein DC540_26145 [Salmonella enterica]|nr:hypothetical protein [Salmonella enterica]